MDIEFTGETEPIEVKDHEEKIQLRLWNYKTGQVAYKELDVETTKKVIEIINESEEENE